MIGTGIFLKPAEMAREGRFVSVVFAAWIVGAILSLFGALSYAELGAMIPEAGGEYAYLRRGFGPVWGFLFGWMHSIVGRPSSASSIAAGLVRFLGFLLPAVATSDLYVTHRDPGAHRLAEALRIRFYLGATPRRALARHHDRRKLSRRAPGGAVQVFLTATKSFRRHRDWRRIFLRHHPRLTLPNPSGRPRWTLACSARFSPRWLRRSGPTMAGRT